ncbi:NAD-dependent deacetylase sirtuin-7 [Verticillium alfalfae VaMs.102]|uniref:protein acetyllysine N-acetyltransferase n=1 Tax=Verticillium alfalfae (strain VaMs.102 / ATCC MYA-4576 / FGSC 10136) TaxID=526221 RepID=C9SN24_VERA1|nr:NAD-dependent deacetylase sirtuin-7 [Verticillium alfalfae VaMs.102]EEY20189.1 NAD-dependent deacetylase sirtuin-7 [Verticillium alfalfae VaMs.102]
MANTAPKIAGLERIENPDVIDRKAETLVGYIRKAKHIIAFTGAGVSTSAGIPDFRGPDGAWTLRAQGRERTGKTTNTLQAIPTLTHMALVELQNQGILKLPRRVHIRKVHPRPPHRPQVRFVARRPPRHDHQLWREPLGRHPAARARPRRLRRPLPRPRLLADDPPGLRDPGDGGRRRGAPATSSSATCKRRRWTGSRASVSSPRTDDLMAAVMAKLGLAIPAFRLRRRLVVELETTGDERHVLRVRGVDVDGTPATFLRSVKIAHARRPARTEPYVIHFNTRLPVGAPLRIELEFMGHYGEPNLEIAHEYNGVKDGHTQYGLEYDPESGQWTTSVVMRGV